MVEDLALNRNLHLLCKALGTLRSQKECKSCRMGGSRQACLLDVTDPLNSRSGGSCVYLHKSVQSVPRNICITEDRRAQNVLEGN